MNEKCTIVTAGATYLDIDAYACTVALTELLCLKGEKAIAYSRAKSNYSVCPSLVKDGQITDCLSEGDVEYIIVDVSDPTYLAKNVPLEKVVKVYDHHTGFEKYWSERIGDGSHIEFIGAAATLIYREWTAAGLSDKMSPFTAKLLVAAILDNTLNLTSKNITEEDKQAFEELCALAGITNDWRGEYFSEVQRGVEADLHNALFGDVKTIEHNPVLPGHMGQLAVWDVDSILGRIDEISSWFDSRYNDWLLNIIDIQNNCNYFICNSTEHQRKIEKVFDLHFEIGIAKTSVAYLRKEIIKKTVF